MSAYPALRSRIESPREFSVAIASVRHRTEKRAWLCFAVHFGDARVWLAFELCELLMRFNNF
jgi:hypothetical protein